MTPFPAFSPVPSSAPRRPLAALLLATLLALLSTAALAPAPALADPPRSVEVVDTTDSVDDATLGEQLEQVDLRAEVELVAMTLDVTEFGYSTDQDDALNSSVRDHARSEHPELLSEDGQKFADGTVIIALDPHGRYLGTYAGEDVKLDDGGFSAVQDAMSEDAQEGDWDAALLAGAEKYADLLGRPWWQHPGALVAGFAVVAGAAGTVLALLGLRRAARRRMDTSLPRFQDVLAKRAVTDSSARTLPEGSPYARAALADHEEYGTKIVEAQQLHDRLPSPSQRSWGWGLRAPQRTLARDFERTVGYLDDTDDTIIAAADLLHRLGDWREAWERELAPLQDSVAGLHELTTDEDGMTAEERQAARELIDLGGGISVELEVLTEDLEQDRIDPDSALERLDTLTRELSAAAVRLQEQRIARVAEDEDEAEVLREAAEDLDTDELEDYSSLRSRRHRFEHAGTSDPLWHLSPVLWYTGWHGTSNDALESHRNPSTASGSTTGYSGGGFSGAGSSSRF